MHLLLWTGTGIQNIVRRAAWVTETWGSRLRFVLVRFDLQ